MGSSAASWGQITFQLFTSLAVAVVAAGLTVWLSLHRFYRERWWERKLASYIEVIEALNHVIRDSDLRIREEEGVSFEKAYRAEHSDAARGDLARFNDLGTFLFAPETASALARYHETVSRLSAEADVEFAEVWEAAKAAAEEALATIKHSAQTDLRLDPKSRTPRL
jgi:hypothetical protein